MAEARLARVAKRFGSLAAVEDLSLTVREGELTSLLGPSGSGKTTILRLIAGYETATAGEIFLGDTRLNAVPAHRRNVGMVFQHYALFPHLTVFDNVGFGLRMRGVRAGEIRRRVDEALHLVQLEGLEGRFPRELSGGQQQRVALARAIVIQPALLLLDEPLSALDPKLRARMQVELRQLQRQLGLTTLYVTHDQEEALAMSDRVAVMNRGRLQQYGSPREIYEEPANGFIADFIGVANMLEAEIVSNGSGPSARIGGLVLPLPSIDGMDQSRVRLALRPEQVRLEHNPDAEGLPASVTNAVYLGTSTHVYLDLDNGPSLVVFLQNTRPALEPLAPGTRVRVSWDPASLKLVRE